MRTLEDVRGELEALLGKPMRQAPGFAEKDWAGVITICKKEGNPRGFVKLVAQLIGVKRDTLGHRVASGSTSVHGRGPPPVIPSAVASAVKEHLQVHQLCSRSYPHRLAVVDTIKVAAQLDLRIKPVTPRMVKRALKKVGLGKRKGERTGAQRAMSVNRHSIAFWHQQLVEAAFHTMRASQKINGDEHSLVGHGGKAKYVSFSKRQSPSPKMNSRTPLYLFFSVLSCLCR